MTAKTKSNTSTTRPAPTKPDIILKHLRHKNGANLPALEKATGWQPHSIRAAVVGLRKKGHAVERSKDGKGATVYRVVE